MGEFKGYKIATPQDVTDPYYAFKPKSSSSSPNGSPETKWIAKWKQEDEFGRFREFRETFPTEQEARERMESIEKSAKEIGKPFTLISIEPTVSSHVESGGESKPEHIPPDTWEMMQRIRGEKGSETESSSTESMTEREKRAMTWRAE